MRSVRRRRILSGIGTILAKATGLGAAGKCRRPCCAVQDFQRRASRRTGRHHKSGPAPSHLSRAALRAPLRRARERLTFSYWSGCRWYPIVLKGRAKAAVPLACVDVRQFAGRSGCCEKNRRSKVMQGYDRQENAERVHLPGRFRCMIVNLHKKSGRSHFKTPKNFMISENRRLEDYSS